MSSPAPAIPSPNDARLAAAAQRALDRSAPSGKQPHLQITESGTGSTPLDLPPLVTRLLRDILRETAAGKTVTLLPAEAEVTTQQAAELLNVSRPHVVGLVENGMLAARLVGTHRRLPLHDVLAYKADNRAKRRVVLTELAAYDQELGLE